MYFALCVSYVAIKPPICLHPPAHLFFFMKENVRPQMVFN